MSLFRELHQSAVYPRGHEHPAWRTWDEFQDQSHDIQQIGIERLPCFGECPAYVAMLSSQGTIDYEGHLYVPRMGKHRGKIDKYSYHRLAQFIQSTRFWEMEPFYDFRDSVVSDAPAACVLVATSTKRKIVSNYMDCGPPELWAIAVCIDSIINSAEWEESNESSPSSST